MSAKILKIPPAYLAEFRHKQKLLIKSRVTLLCWVIVVIYLFTSAASFFMDADSFRPQEIPVAVFLLLGGFLVLLLNRRVPTLRAAKFRAFLFTFFLLGISTKLGLVYPGYDISEAYVLSLFFVSLVIPWFPSEVVWITLLHAGFYMLYYLAAGPLRPEGAEASLNAGRCVDSLFFLGAAFVMCFVIRHKETKREMKNFLLLKDVETKNDQMEKELKLATRVHQTLVPSSLQTDKFHVEVSFLPMRHIGGDYARFHELDSDRFLFIICDVTGHGVPAALMVSRIHTEFERLVKERRSPGLLLKDLNDFIVRDFAETQMYLSAFCGLLDFREMSLRYSNYGHPAQYLYHARTSGIKPLESHTSWLGVPFAKNGAVYESQAPFERGDWILLFTDGVPEAVSGKGEPYGERRVQSFLQSHCRLEASEFNRQMLRELEAFSGRGFQDDIFILSIQIKKEPARSREVFSPSR